MAELLVDVKDIKRDIKILKTMMVNKKSVIGDDINIKLPVNTHAELQCLEDVLTNKEKYNTLVCVQIV